MPVQAPLRPSVAAGVFGALIASVTLLQKVGVPLGGEVVEVAFLVLWGALFVLLLFQPPVLHPMRLALFALFVLTMLVSQLAGGQPFSLASALLAVVVYLPFCFSIEVDAATYRRCLDMFVTAMLIVGLAVIVQQVMQWRLGWTSWLDLNRFLPRYLSVPGYNYLQPVTYGSRFYKPNAFVFLEGSFVAQFIALGLIVEVALFQRVSRLVFLGATLLLTFSGSGFLLLAVSAPFLVGRLSFRALAALIFATAIAAALALGVGWFDQLHTRFGEVGARGSSGYYRYNLPFQIISDMASHPQYLWTGHGAGSTGHGDDQGVAGFILIPAAKVIYEYGFVPTLAFYAFFTYAMFRAAPSLAVAIAVFVFYNLGGGGFVVPAYVVTGYVIAVLLRPVGRRRSLPDCGRPTQGQHQVASFWGPAPPESPPLTG